MTFAKGRLGSYDEEIVLRSFDSHDRPRMKTVFLPCNYINLRKCFCLESYLNPSIVALLSPQITGEVLLTIPFIIFTVNIRCVILLFTGAFCTITSDPADFRGSQIAGSVVPLI